MQINSTNAHDVMGASVFTFHRVEVSGAEEADEEEASHSFKLRSSEPVATISE